MVLDSFSATVVCVLRKPCTGRVQDVCRTCTGRVQDVYRTCTGRVQDVYRTCTGRVQDAGDGRSRGAIGGEEDSDSNRGR